MASNTCINIVYAPILIESYCWNTHKANRKLTAKLKINVLPLFQEERWKVWATLSYCTKRTKCHHKSYPNNTIKTKPASFFPILGTSFNSCEEGKEFYNLYSWEVGFGIHSGKSRNNGNSYQAWHDYVCSCEVWGSIHYKIAVYFLAFDHCIFGSSIAKLLFF
jgi:hypothetical protein